MRHASMVSRPKAACCSWEVTVATLHDFRSPFTKLDGLAIATSGANVNLLPDTPPVNC